MTAVVYKLRDYQSKRAIERAHAELEKHIAEVANIPYGGQGIDGIPYVETTGFTAPDKDSA